MAQIKCVFNINSFILIEFAENHIFGINVAIYILQIKIIFLNTKISHGIRIKYPNH